MQGLRLDQHALQIQLAEQLPEHRLPVVLAGGISCLVGPQPQGGRIERRVGVGVAYCSRLKAEPPPLVGLIELLRLLLSYTSSLR